MRGETFEDSMALARCLSQFFYSLLGQSDDGIANQTARRSPLISEMVAANANVDAQPTEVSS
jgi:hypothetical protein